MASKCQGILGIKDVKVLNRALSVVMEIWSKGEYFLEGSDFREI